MELANDVAQLDATALAEAIRKGTYTSEEAVQSLFERIDRLNGKYNALVSLDRPRALQRAREADLAQARGQSWGPLHGVPITVKDSFRTAGLRTTAGYAPLRDSVPDRDADAVARLKNAGAIVIGKSNCAPLCSDLQTRNDIFGTTGNPWEAGRTAGGSSGGEAAAVALGLSPLGLGSDSGGSIRVPASYCGVYGFKPSIGKIARDGLIPPLGDPAREDSLTVVGAIARSVRDLALSYSILSGEPYGIDAAPQHAPRIAWTGEFPRQLMDDEVSSALEAAYRTLSDSGASVEKVEPPLDLHFLNFKYFMLNMYEFSPRESSPGLHKLFWLFESARSVFSGGIEANYKKLKADQREQVDLFDRFAQQFDCWALPATPTAAFHHQKSGRPIPIRHRGKSKRYSYWHATGGFAFLANFLGCPSVAIPIGRDRNGLPIGIQVVGRREQDTALLRTAAHIAERIGSTMPLAT
ncbi:hypothetical protein BI347_14820 [Chromobacterium sphagni]|uniref:Amidase domain-containing protein n=1 Tax=Chromobacterium sphagni TaxID=1903179 RepID=A0A1S1X576_9NEIS|nr:amidase [Chromobacterium sphagni]OHX14638.1 hypothetical protein BI347_14820 [Chromobacterium sphagni]